MAERRVFTPYPLRGKGWDEEWFSPEQNPADLLWPSP
jgi:hypothetical protein